MKTIQVLGLFGLAAILFVGIKWGPLIFTPVLDFFGKILKLLSQLPRTMFMLFSCLVLDRLEMIPDDVIGVFPVLSWEFLSFITISAACILAISWDTQKAKFLK